MLMEYRNDLALQSAYLLLRYCAEPRIAHLLRCARPELICDAAKRHDKAIVRALNALLGPGDLLRITPGGRDWQSMLRVFNHVQPSDEEYAELARLARQHAALPLRRGGLGLVPAEHVSQPAYVGCMALTARFLARERMVHADDNGVCYGFPISGEAFARELREGEHAYQRAARLAWHTCGALIAERSLVGSSIEEITSCANVDSLHIAKVQSQTLLSRELAEGRARLLLSSCTDVGGIVARAERVRLTSCSGRGATGFLRGMPTSYMSQLENVVFRSSARPCRSSSAPS